MNFGRYSFIHKYFRIEDFLKDNAIDKIHKVRYFLEYQIERWQRSYYPSRNVCVDETLIPYKGNVSFRVCMPNKPAKEGILMYSFADSDTAYMLKFEVFTGKSKKQEESTFATKAVVLRMIEGYLDKGHILFLDNYYTTIDLCNYLYTRKTGCIGILRYERSGDKNLHLGLKKGELKHYSYSKYKHILLTIWYNAIIVQAISNCRKIESVVYFTYDRKPKLTPLVFRDYSKKKIGVDMNNHITALKRYPHKSWKWWVVFFNYILQVTITNAYIIFRNNQLRALKTENRNLVWRKKEFTLYIIRRLLNMTDATKKKDMDLFNRSITEEEGDLTKLIHFPMFVRIKQNCKFKDCNGKTNYFCPDCDLNFDRYYLCYPKCFEKLHFKRLKKREKYARQ